MKVVLFLYCLAGAFSSANAVQTDKLVWYGVDFTASNFVLVPENPQEIVSRYIPAINYVILSEPAKYDIRKFFGAQEVIFNLDPVSKLNLAIDPMKLVTSREQTFEKDKVSEIISRYDTGNDSGTGLVFIAVNLNKATGMASYYACLFDIAGKKVLDARFFTAPASGFGFRNFWVSSVYKVMNSWYLQQHRSDDPLYN